MPLFTPEERKRTAQSVSDDELPVLHHFATAFGETLVRGFLLENLLELDLPLLINRN